MSQKCQDHPNELDSKHHRLLSFSPFWMLLPLQIDIVPHAILHQTKLENSHVFAKLKSVSLERPTFLEDGPPRENTVLDLDASSRVIEVSHVHFNVRMFTRFLMMLQPFCHLEPCCLRSQNNLMMEFVHLSTSVRTNAS